MVTRLLNQLPPLIVSVRRAIRNDSTCQPSRRTAGLRSAREQLGTASIPGPRQLLFPVKCSDILCRSFGIQAKPSSKWREVMELKTQDWCQRDKLFANQ